MFFEPRTVNRRRAPYITECGSAGWSGLVCSEIQGKYHTIFLIIKLGSFGIMLTLKISGVRYFSVGNFTEISTVKHIENICDIKINPVSFYLTLQPSNWRYCP